MTQAVVTDHRRKDRRREHRLVLGERRSGFDRRRRRDRSAAGAAFDAALLFLRDHPTALIAVLAIANLLSALDLRLTLLAVQHGVAEANPVMRYFLGAGSASATVAKVGLVAAASLAIWLLRRHRQALELALGAMTLFAAVVLYEIAWLT